MEEALDASGAEIVTVALRRIDPAAKGSVLDVLDRLGLFALPNTAGCYTARDAVRTARLAREAFETDWVKLEVIGDDRTLLPGRGRAARRRRDAGRRRLHRAALHQRRPDPRPPPRGGRLRRGDAARLADRHRRWASATPTTSRSSSSRRGVPVILDAGIGTASDAALAMELGCDAVLLASSIFGAEDPVAMARGDARRGRGRPRRPPGRPHPAPHPRRGLDPRGGPARALLTRDHAPVAQLVRAAAF